MVEMLLLALIFFVVSTAFSLIEMGGGILSVPVLLVAGALMWRRQKHAPSQTPTEDKPWHWRRNFGGKKVGTGMESFL